MNTQVGVACTAAASHDLHLGFLERLIDFSYPDRLAKAKELTKILDTCTWKTYNKVKRGCCPITQELEQIMNHLENTEGMALLISVSVP